MNTYATLTLQVAKDYDRARDAFEKAATGHSRQGSPWQSGKNLEKAAGSSYLPRMLHGTQVCQRSTIHTALCFASICGVMLADMEKEWNKAQHSSKGRGTRVEALYRDAALSFQEAGRHQAAAEALGRAAVHLEGIEPEVDSVSSVPGTAEARCRLYLIMSGHRYS